MKSHADFFRSHLHVPFGQQCVGVKKLSEWISSPHATLTAPRASGYPQSFQALSGLQGFFTFEAAIFASAALESLSTVQSKWKSPTDRDGLAWRLIGLYYAAYYASHSILRLSGVSVTQIESWQKTDKEFDTLYKTPTFPVLGLQSGYHILTIDTSRTSISIVKAVVDSAHRSHTALWREFKNLADKCYSNNAFNTTQHQNAVNDYVGKLSLPLQWDGLSCNWPWMPMVRNRINYRLPDLIWGKLAKRISPTINKEIHELILAPTSRQIANAAGSDSVWLKFVASCVYLLSLLGALLRDMEIRAKNKSHLPAVFGERSTLISKLCVS